ncbi:MAG: hypothetical protein LBR79_00370 [Oscillospiraceae bacterium]|nr:hypothetical protein [Oscillospiraceae bacterium]
MKFLLSPPAYGGGERYYQLIWVTTQNRLRRMKILPGDFDAKPFFK